MHKMIQGTPAIGERGTLFVADSGSNDPIDGNSIAALDKMTGAVLWRFYVGEQSVGAGGIAVGANGLIYAGSINHRLFALDGATGDLKWWFGAESAILSTPALNDEGLLYVGSADKSLYALDAATGGLKWRFRTSGIVKSSPAIGRFGAVYFGSADAKIYAVHGATGALLWTFTTGGPVYSSPAIDADGTVYVGSNDQKLYALNYLDGSNKWEFRAAGLIAASPVVSADGRVFVALQDGTLYSLDKVTGQELWHNALGGPPNDDYEEQFGAPRSSPALGADGLIYLAAGDRFYALNAADGTTNWLAMLNTVSHSSPTIDSDGTVYVGTGWFWDQGLGKVYAFPGFAGLADAPWPKFHRNLRNDGQALTAGAGPPVIFEAPTNELVVARSEKYLRVVADGAGPLDYQWYFQGQALADGTARSYRIPSFQNSHAGEYYVVVKNALGQLRTTNSTIAIGYTLDLTTSGAGSITREPDQLIYAADTTVLVTAHPAVGRVFLGWQGDIAQTNSQISITLGRNLRATAYFETFSGELLWTFATGGSILHSAAIGPDGTVYFSTALTNGFYEGMVTALDPRGRVKKWEFPWHGAITTAPAIDVDGTVYVRATPLSPYCLWGRLLAIDGVKGVEKWEIRMDYSCDDTSALEPIVSADGDIYVQSNYYNLSAFNKATGEQVWFADLSAASSFSCAPVAGADGMVYASVSGLYLAAVNATNGNQQWRVPLPGQPVTAPAMGWDGTIYLATLPDNLVAFDHEAGARKWQYSAGQPISSSPVLGLEESLFFAAGRSLYALDARSGAERWRFPAGGDIVSTAAVGADGSVYFGCLDHRIYALNGATGQLLWTYETGGGIRSSPTLTTDGALYVGSDDGFLYALQVPAGLAASAWPKFRGNARNAALLPAFKDAFGSRMLLAGTSTNISANLVADSRTSYQWYYNNQPVAGATNSELVFPSVSLNHSGAYHVVASNASLCLTNGPAAWGVYNTVPSNLVLFTLPSPAGTAVEIQYADTLSKPWLTLAGLTPTNNSSSVVDVTAGVSDQRFYRLQPPVDFTLQIGRGWTFTAPAGSQYQIDYVELENGYTNWHSLTNITLPSSPYLFIDLAARHNLSRFYRTTLMR